MMNITDCGVIIIGGGPAGSTCAWRLRKHGIESHILDTEDFPRTKLCAGWITPAVAQNLEMAPEVYPHRLVTFSRIYGEYFGKKSARKIVFNTTQHSIRRYEFDNWLLERSGAHLHKHRVKEIRKDGDGYIIDGRFRCKILVGAGGTHCPVFRTFFRDVNPRSKEYQVGALEEEFAYDYKDDNCYLWFAEKGLVGYSWYVPKGNGWINVGIGGFSEYLKQGRLCLRDHWELFKRKLADLGLITNYAYNPKGHTYHVRETAKVGQLGNAYIVGDSAGLATRDLAEGIGPAVESGIDAADAIATGKPFSLKRMTKYSSIGPGLMTELVDRCFDRKGVFFKNFIYARKWRTKEPSSPAVSGQTGEFG
ncbi:MAG TPA: NAD(P)/FAD-dependent oxidoreductase [Acidobacteriota bacterium]|jgi:flavin-dependent dehydrogenase